MDAVINTVVSPISKFSILWLSRWHVPWGVEALEMKCTWIAIVKRKENGSASIKLTDSNHRIDIGDHA